MVCADLDRVMQDDQLQPGSRAQTIHRLLKQWHEGQSAFGPCLQRLIWLADPSFYDGLLADFCVT